uniref:Uncharacterized protein n=1 Tax=Arundo donax TaxID=35708 RepID=A0A0A9BC31_ARUDO
MLEETNLTRGRGIETRRGRGRTLPQNQRWTKEERERTLS